MQIILLLIEIFMPEIAAQLAAGERRSVRKKLQRAGLGLVLIASFVAIVAVYVQIILRGLPLAQIDMLAGGPLTALALLIVGASLLWAARATVDRGEGEPLEVCEPPAVRNVEVGRPDEQIWSAYLEARRNPSARNPVKLKTIHLSDCTKGVMPSEAWMFFARGHAFLVVHKIETGSQLWMDDRLIDRNAEKMHFGTQKNPCLRASITEGEALEVVVYFRARMHIRIRISLNGNWLNEEFV